LVLEFILVQKSYNIRMKKISVITIFIFSFLVSFGGSDLDIKSRKAGIKKICTSKYGDTLYVAVRNKVFIWHLATGSMLRSVKTDVMEISSIVISPEDNTLIVAGLSAWGKGKLEYLNRKSLESKNIITFRKKVLALAISGDGKKLAVSADHKIELYNFMDKTPYDSIVTDFHSLALDLNRNGNLLAYGGSNKRLILRNLMTNTDVASVGHGDWVRKAEIGYSEKLLISAGDDEDVHLTDISNLEDISSSILTGHKDRIYALMFSPDEQYIISGSSDRSYIIWDVDQKTLLEKHKLKRRGTVTDVAVAVDCKQLVTTSLASRKMKVFEISHLNIIPRNTIFRDDEDKEPPQIYVSSPERVVRQRIVTYDDPFPVKGTVVDESGLRNLTLNGVEISVRENGYFAQFVPLAYGDNPIVIEAEDINGNISVKRFTLVRKSTRGEIFDTSEATNYLLIVGINKYNHWPELSNAVNDAKSVEEVLLRKYKFDVAETTILIDEKATRNSIYNAMRNYIELVGPNDNLLIYYAGHGYFDELLNEGYWVPVDASLGQEAEYLPNTTILKIIGSINSKHTFLVADACFSGSLFAERARGYAENVERYKSRWGLASGRLEEVADGSGKHSPFASSFIECLENNDKEDLPASEVVQYVKNNVSEMARQTPRGSPLKNVGDEGGEFVFKKKDVVK